MVSVGAVLGPWAIWHPSGKAPPVPTLPLLPVTVHSIQAIEVSDIHRVQATRALGNGDKSAL